MAICLIGVRELDGGVLVNVGLGSDALFVWQTMQVSIDAAMLAFIPGQ